jgi:hypothetical protein
MNTTIKTIFVAICLLATKITTHAQLKKVKTPSNAAISPNQPVKSSIVDLVKSTPIQSVNLGQVKGIFKIPAPGAWSSKIGNLFTDYTWRLRCIGTYRPWKVDSYTEEMKACFDAGGYMPIAYFDGKITFDSTDKQNVKFVIYNVPYVDKYNSSGEQNSARNVVGMRYILELEPKAGIKPILATENSLLLQNCFSGNIPNCLSENPLSLNKGAIIKCEAENRISTLNISLSEIFTPN